MPKGHFLFNSLGLLQLWGQYVKEILDKGVCRRSKTFIIQTSDNIIPFAYLSDIFTGISGLVEHLPEVRTIA